MIIASSTAKEAETEDDATDALANMGDDGARLAVAFGTRAALATGARRLRCSLGDGASTIGAARDYFWHWGDELDLLRLNRFRRLDGRLGCRAACAAKAKSQENKDNPHC